MSTQNVINAPIPFALSQGGTGANITANNGGIFYSNASTGAVLAGTATANQMLQSGSNSAPAWSTATYPATTTINQLLYSSSANVVTGLATATTAVLTTSAGVPTWANQLSLALGGTNASLTASNGGIVYSTASAMAVLGGTATANQVLLSGSSTTPAWSTATFASTYSASTLLYSNGANTVTGLATANSASLVTNSTGVPAWSGTMTNGQLIIGSTGATPTAGTLTAGSNISITNGAASITVAATGFASFAYNDVAGTSQNAAVNNGYIISNAGQTTVNIPATAAEGSVIAVQGKGAGGWIVQMNTGQVCHLGNAASSSAGSLTSTNQWDAVEIVCVTANTVFAVKSVIGNITVA